MNYDELQKTDEALMFGGDMITLSSNFLVPTKIFTNPDDGEDYGDLYCADVYCVTEEEKNTGYLFFRPYTDRSLEKYFFYKGAEVKDVEVTFKWSDDADGKRLYEFTNNAVVRILNNECDLVTINTMLPNRSLILAAKVIFVEMFSFLEEAKMSDKMHMAQ